MTNEGRKRIALLFRFHHLITRRGPIPQSLSILGDWSGRGCGGWRRCLFICTVTSWVANFCSKVARFFGGAVDVEKPLAEARRRRAIRVAAVAALSGYRGGAVAGGGVVQAGAVG